MQSRSHISALVSQIMLSVPILMLTVAPPGTGAEELTLGVLAPLTGVRADAGRYIQTGVELAIDQVNAAPSTRYKLKLVIEDSHYDPKTALAGFLKLITLNKTRFVIGPGNTSEVLAVAPLLEREKIILLVPGAQSEEITDASPMIVRLIHNTAQEAPFFARFVARHMHSDTLHFLAGTMAVTPSYLKHFRPALEAAGKKIGKIEEFGINDSDYRAQLLRLKGVAPTDIFLIATPLIAGNILRQASELGVQVQWYNLGLEGPELSQIAGKAAEGLLYPYSYDSGSDEPGARAFFGAYMERYGSEPETLAANSYDAVKLLSNCVARVGSEVTKVNACLHAIQDYHGASGSFSISAKGDAEKVLFVKTIKNGKFVRYVDS